MFLEFKRQTFAPPKASRESFSWIDVTFAVFSSRDIGCSDLATTSVPRTAQISIDLFQPLETWIGMITSEVVRQNNGKRLLVRGRQGINVRIGHTYHWVSIQWQVTPGHVLSPFPIPAYRGWAQELSLSRLENLWSLDGWNWNSSTKGTAMAKYLQIWIPCSLCEPTCN